MYLSRFISPIIQLDFAWNLTNFYKSHSIVLESLFSMNSKWAGSQTPEVFRFTLVRTSWSSSQRYHFSKCTHIHPCIYPHLHTCIYAHIHTCIYTLAYYMHLASLTCTNVAFTAASPIIHYNYQCILDPKSVLNKYYDIIPAIHTLNLINHAQSPSKNCYYSFDNHLKETSHKITCT